VPLIPCLLLGFMGGLVNVPLRAAYLAAVPADARGNGTAVMNTAIYLMTALLAGLVVVLTQTGLLTSAVAQLSFLAALAGLGVVITGLFLLPPFLELLLAGLMWPFYRVRAHGPGRDRVPTSGPLVVVCNHSAYLDPFWLGKVMPRKLTPMMTSVFYDRPMLRWLMRWVVGAIRVQASRFRREAPELDEAVALLRRGGCLLLFPEAILRREEEKLLRNFGQGVWRILREVPDTPVVVCWLEGGAVTPRTRTGRRS
jgi:1-acyl-sn-glycerol-3-phosphate acyltransferase